MRARSELLWFCWAAQVGGSASATHSQVGFLRPTWSLWTDRRRPRRRSRTTQARCSRRFASPDGCWVFAVCRCDLVVSPQVNFTSPSKPTKRSRGTRSRWSSARPSRSFTNCWTAGGSSGTTFIQTVKFLCGQFERLFRFFR